VAGAGLTLGRCNVGRYQRPACRPGELRRRRAGPAGCQVTKRRLLRREAAAAQDVHRAAAGRSRRLEIARVVAGQPGAIRRHRGQLHRAARERGLRLAASAAGAGTCGQTSTWTGADSALMTPAGLTGTCSSIQAMKRGRWCGTVPAGQPTYSTRNSRQIGGGRGRGTRVARMRAATSAAWVGPQLRGRPGQRHHRGR
jgi:hypothetical protein